MIAFQKYAKFNNNPATPITGQNNNAILFHCAGSACSSNYRVLSSVSARKTPILNHYKFRIFFAICYGFLSLLAHKIWSINKEIQILFTSLKPEFGIKPHVFTHQELSQGVQSHASIYSCFTSSSVAPDLCPWTQSLSQSRCFGRWWMCFRFCANRVGVTF